jgi:endogenous inhibitor of DNA gyrase (YacG/DUF329 family)
MSKIVREQTTHIGGDETCGFKIKLPRRMTLREFCQEICNDVNLVEWGYFEIKPRNEEECFKTKFADYVTAGRNANSVGGFDPDSFDKELYETNKNKIVKSISGSGGWGRMDYMIELED